MRRMGETVTSTEINKLMSRFDKNEDERITLDEFMEEVLPKALI
jgi:Ca2+-binding EF-hand superfamily protein